MTASKRCWPGLVAWLAWLNGDAAYRAYRAAWDAAHAGCGHEPLSRAAFHREELERRWNGVRRCC